MSTQPSPETARIAIADLHSFPGNARRGNVGMIADSLLRHGQYRALVVQKSTMRVLAGNHTLAAGKSLGWTHMDVTLVDCDDDAAVRINLVDNRANDVADYDLAALAAQLQGLPELDGTGWDADAMKALLDSINGAGGPAAGRTDPDDVPDIPDEDPVSQVGDVWELGPHRLMCGDSGSELVLEWMVGDGMVGCVLTDPPYGMNLDADYSKMPGAGKKAQMVRQPKKYRQVIGDDKPFDAGPIRARCSGVQEQFWFGADYYRSTLSGDDRDGSWLIWDKRNEEQDNVIGSGFETIWSARGHQRRMLRHYWCGAFGKPEARERMHPTQKPISLLADIIERWSPVGGVVADFYGGSGSTLIACHTIGRTCRMVELDPRYADVIARRYEAHTGIAPVRDGIPVSFSGVEVPV